VEKHGDVVQQVVVGIAKKMDAAGIQRKSERRSTSMRGLR